MPNKRKLPKEKTIEILMHVMHHPMSILELHDKSKGLFGVELSKEVSKLLLKGETVFSEKELPIAGTTWEEYMDMVDTIKGRNYKALAHAYRT